MTTLPAGAEGPRIAKDIIMDVIQCAGFDLTALGNFLEGCRTDSKSLSGMALMITHPLCIEKPRPPVESTRRSLALCQPTPALGTTLRKTIQRLTSEPIVDKPRLLIKSTDLVGTFLEHHCMQQKKIDVVSMGLLTHQGGFSVSVCARCGGRSEVVSNSESTFAGSRWKTWEKTWRARCICGGLWAH